jgi:hypothetical protein
MVCASVYLQNQAFFLEDNVTHADQAQLVVDRDICLPAAQPGASQHREGDAFGCRVCTGSGYP